MYVKFDFEVDEQYEYLVQNPESYTYSDELRNYIIEKLRPIESEIVENEVRFANEHNGEIAYFRLNMMTEPYSMQCMGYNPALELKVVDLLRGCGKELDSRLTNAKARLNN